MLARLKQALRFARARRKGLGVIVFIVVFGTVATTIIIMGVASYGLSEHRASVRKHDRDMAFHIAEAGANYYRWHLAHDDDDYWDGNPSTTPGPYVHDYVDKDNNIIGQFSLEITPPLSGSTVVTVQSTGWLNSRPTVQRTVEVTLGYPGLTDYAFVENANMIFSNTTEVHGKVHSNGTIEFNGTTDAAVEAVGLIWGTGGPTEFWNTPVPWIDFNSVSADLVALKDLADNGGVSLGDSGDEGYYINFQDDGTFDVYVVDSVSCYYGLGYQWWWWWIGDVHCYDRNSLTFSQTYNIPANGAVYVDDHVWVDGVVDGRVTVGARRAGASPTNYRNVYISGDLMYEEQASDDVLGLIAQGDIIVPKNVPDDMQIHAAALSQTGQIYRPYYRTTYSDSLRNSLLFFGSQISFAGGGWKWVSYGTVVSGFVNTNHTYDGNLMLLPPPGFPVGDTYELLSWEEIES